MGAGLATAAALIFAYWTTIIWFAGGMMLAKQQMGAKDAPSQADLGLTALPALLCTAALILAAGTAGYFIAHL